MSRTVQKVACYITRGNQLLVFDHPHSPEAGTQVPGGTVDPGEPLELAALREAREESGVQDLALRAG
ncbi:MAG: NUDIX domain-containing protein, partial [Anaerolineales bacterium]|nr:NUDIX domain-containing protein [Anaerolineales bacterium]